MSSNTTIYKLLRKYENFDASVYFPKEPFPAIDIDFDDDDHEVQTAWGFPSGKANINYGGDNVREAWKNGSYDHIDMSQLVKKSWKKRDKEEACSKMCDGHVKWRKENSEVYRENQRKASLIAWQKGQRLRQIKLKYKGEIYYGWSALSRATGRTKWFLQKDSEVSIV